MVQIAQVKRPDIMGVASRPVNALFPGTLFRLWNDESGRVWSAQLLNGYIVGWPLLEDWSILTSNALVDPEAEALVLDPSDLGITRIIEVDPTEVELSE